MNLARSLKLNRQPERAWARSLAWSLVLIILFGSHGCRTNQKYEDNAELEEAAKGLRVPGLQPEQVAAIAHPIRLQLLEANRALCTIPFAQTWDTWLKGEAGNYISREESEALRRKVQQDATAFILDPKELKLKREHHITADLSGQLLMQGIVAGEGAVKLAAVGADKATIFATAARPYIYKATVDSKSLTALAASLEKQVGLQAALKFLHKIVPPLRSGQDAMARLLNFLEEKSALGLKIDDGILATSDKVSSIAPVLGSALRVANFVVAGVSDSMLACDLMSGTIAQLEMWEVAARIQDPKLAVDEKLRLTEHYCTTYRRTHQGEYPQGVSCKRS